MSEGARGPHRSLPGRADWEVVPGGLGSVVVVGWVLFGFLVGTLAHLVTTGGRSPGGSWATMLLATAGAVLGGYAGRGLGWYGEGEPTSFVMAGIGSVAFLALYRWLYDHAHHA